MRSIKIDDIFLEDLMNTSLLPDIFEYSCLTRKDDILNSQFLQELSQKINIDSLELEIYHNWFLIDNKYYYFKYHYIFEELLMEKIFETFHVPCVRHKIVKYRGKIGIISENFRKSNCEYKDYESAIPNNIDCPLSIVRYNEIIKSEMNIFDYQYYLQLISKIISIDILFGQFDHHAYNIMFEISDFNFRLAPMFDNGNIFKEDDYLNTYIFESCFGTFSFSLNDFYKDSRTIKIIQSFPELYNSLEEALYFDLTKIFNLLEHDYQLEIYKKLRNQIQTYYDQHRKMIEKTLKLAR